MKNGGICHRHKTVNARYDLCPDYWFSGDHCDWCERIDEAQERQKLLDSGKKVWTVVVRCGYDTSVEDNLSDVQKTYPGFEWKHVNRFMETDGFGTYMTKEEQKQWGLYKRDVDERDPE